MYLTLDDLLHRFNDIHQAADHDGDGEADSAVIANAIADACGEVDSYLRGRYALPIIGDIPDDLVKFSCDIARWHIYGNEATALVAERYKRAVAWLKEVAMGTVILPINSLSDTQDTRLAVIAPTRVYTAELFAKYQV